MFCSKCGSQIPDNASFCGACGTPVVLPTTSAPASTTATDTPTAPPYAAAAQNNPAGAPMPQQTFNPAEAPVRKSNKGLIIGIVCVVAIIVIALVIGLTQMSSQPQTNTPNNTATSSSSSSADQAAKEAEQKAQEEAARKAQEEAAQKAQEEAARNGVLGSWTIVWGDGRFMNFHTITFNADGTGTDAYKGNAKSFTWSFSQITDGGDALITKTGDNADEGYVYNINTGVLRRGDTVYDRG